MMKVHNCTLVRVVVGFLFCNYMRTVLDGTKGIFHEKKEESLSMRKRRLQTISVAPPAIQKAFEQFQKQNEAKNLSQGTIEFYSAKSKNFFLFLEDTEESVDTIIPLKSSSRASFIYRYHHGFQHPSHEQ